MKYLIKGGRIIDPSNSVDEVMDVMISDGKIAGLGKNLTDKADKTIDASGKIVAPGLIDMHTHLREPGREDEETIASGTRSAAKGGYTSIACMPNTEPAIDDVKMVQLVKDIIKKDALCNVFIIAATTNKRAGKELTDFRAMKKEGVVGISDDGASIDDKEVLEQALKEAGKNDLALIEHCEDTKLSAGGVINKSYIATKMGLRGISRQSEYERIARNIEIARKTKEAIHIAHVSCKESVELIRKAKRDKIRVTAETAPHYFTITEECCVTYDTNTKMNPPLRSQDDAAAIKEGLRDGAIDVIATDHAPHTDAEKDVEFDYAPFGILGLETALSLAVMELIDAKILSWPELIAKMSRDPARILKIDRGTLGQGKTADVIIIDPSKEYIFKKDTIESISKNSPFIDWKLKAKVEYVFIGGTLICLT